MVWVLWDIEYDDAGIPEYEKYGEFSTKAAAQAAEVQLTRDKRLRTSPWHAPVVLERQGASQTTTQPAQASNPCG